MDSTNLKVSGRAAASPALPCPAASPSLLLNGTGARNRIKNLMVGQDKDSLTSEREKQKKKRKPNQCKSNHTSPADQSLATL